MRVMMPSGTILEISKAIAVCEQRLVYNGRDLRLCERATDIAYGNGVAFFPSEVRAYDSCGLPPHDTVLFGNLTNEFVREILGSLVWQGYVDLSDLKLQKTQSLAPYPVFDNGKSDAYIHKGCAVDLGCADALPYPFVIGDRSVESEAEEEDDEDAGEEDCNE